MPDPVSSSSKSALLVAFITASLANLASPQSILAPSPAVAARDDGSSPAAKAGGDIDGFFNWPVGRDIVVGGGGAATRHEEAQEKAKRGYKAEGDAYIRFGKRSQEMEESLVQYDVSFHRQSRALASHSFALEMSAQTLTPMHIPLSHSQNCRLVCGKREEARGPSRFVVQYTPSKA